MIHIIHYWMFNYTLNNHPISVDHSHYPFLDEVLNLKEISDFGYFTPSIFCTAKNEL